MASVWLYTFVESPIEVVISFIKISVWLYTFVELSIDVVFALLNQCVVISCFVQIYAFVRSIWIQSNQVKSGDFSS